MKRHHQKALATIALMSLLLAGMLLLTGCAGKGSLSSEIIDETGAYKVTANDAGKGSAVMMSGGFVVEEGQIVAVSPDIKKGNLQVKLMDASGEVVLDEKVTGSVLETFELDPGDYAIAVACNENGATGTVLVVPVGAAEFEKQNQNLEAALAAMAEMSAAVEK